MLCNRIHFLPVIIISGVFFSPQHRVCGDNHHYCVGGGNFRSLSVVLRILQGIDVLGDPIALLMSVSHIALESEEVQSMDSATHGLEVVEEFRWIHPGLVKLGRF